MDHRSRPSQWSMNLGRTVFAQLMEHFPAYDFQKCVARYDGDFRKRSFSCFDQFLCLSFAQLSYRGGLRDIEACLRSVQESFITWAPAAASRAPFCRTPTSLSIGASTPTSHKS